MADVFCNQCGHKNPLGSNFCSSCGAPLEKELDDPTTITFQVDAPEDLDADITFDLDDIPADGGLVIVVRGPNAGTRLSIDRDVTTLGRHPKADLLLDDVTVSRKHVEIVRAGSGFRVRDAGSLNGTYLNGERVDDAALANADEIQIGRYKLAFYAGR